MSNVIELLERVGQDPDLRYGTSEMLEEALRGAGIEPALRAAILGNDIRKLEALLGAPPNVCCAVHQHEEEEEDGSDEEEEQKENQEESP